LPASPQGEAAFWKSALIHRHAEVIRALQINKNLPGRNCFPEGSNLFTDKPDFGPLINFLFIY